MANSRLTGPFAAATLRAPLEALVSRYVGGRWTIRRARDMTDFASHPCAILSDGRFDVFAKLSHAADGAHLFAVETAGLRDLTERAGIVVPTPIGIVQTNDAALLVLEAVQAVERKEREWRAIGRTLARIHRVKSDRFGLERDGFFGSLPQSNRPAADWITFFGERRLRAMQEVARAAGHLPLEVDRAVERLIERLPLLCGEEVVPALLHGDAQQNNFISSAAGAVAVDPAVYFGHPEVDLAYVDYFEPVAPALFAGYQEEETIDPGFWERRELWRIWGHLAVVAVGEASYLDKLTAALKRYL